MCPPPARSRPPGEGACRGPHRGHRPAPGSRAGIGPCRACVRAGGRGRLPGGTPARDQMPPVLAPGLHGHGQNLTGPGPGPGKAPCFPPRVTLVSPAPRGPGQRWGSFSSVAGAARWARRAGSAVTVQRCPRSTKDRDSKETQAWPRANKTLFAKVATGRGVQPLSRRLACSVASGQPAKPGLGGELGPLREPPGRGGPSRLPVLRAASSPRPASGSRPTSQQPGVGVAGREDVRDWDLPLGGARRFAFSPGAGAGGPGSLPARRPAIVFGADRTHLDPLCLPSGPLAGAGPLQQRVLAASSHGRLHSSPRAEHLGVLASAGRGPLSESGLRAPERG